MFGKDPARRLVKAAAPVTDAFAGWESPWIDVMHATFCALYLALVKADATSFEVRVIGEDGAQEDGFRLVEGETWDRTLTASDLEAEDRVALRLPLDWAQRVKVQVRKAGGTGEPTCEAHLLAVTR